MVGEHAEVADFKAWASLLGLLSFKEYFVPVDHSVLWQRHVAWAKPKGEDLRQYVTQSFASNMVVLSLMLGFQINVFFNSATELHDMRTLLGSEKYGDLRYWVGILIILDAVVTIMALIATFTLWKMISSISDANTHALLRSSIGLYVISLPPRFVVAALYLFIAWLTLFWMDMMSGPAKIILPIVILILFFQVILPLSVFGRLIIDTGAMAKRRVLDEDFEKECTYPYASRFISDIFSSSYLLLVFVNIYNAVLPSGLHASLLIRATGQRRKYTSVIHQYKRKYRYSSSMEEEDDLPERGRRSMVPPPPPQTQSRQQLITDDVHIASSRSSTSLSPVEEEQILDTVKNIMEVQKEMDPTAAHGHRRSASGDVYFPQACVLNSAVHSSDLMDVVQQALTESERDEEEEKKKSTTSSLGTIEEGEVCSCDTTIIEEGRNPSPTHIHSDDSISLSPLPPCSPSSGLRSKRQHKVSSPLLARETMPQSILVELAEQRSVRDLYEDPPKPARLIQREEVMSIAAGTETLTPFNRQRRCSPSFYNRIRGLGSLQNLGFHEELDTPECSDDEMEESIGGRDEKKLDEYELVGGGGSLHRNRHDMNEQQNRFGEQTSLLGRRRSNLQYYNGNK